MKKSANLRLVAGGLTAALLGLGLSGCTMSGPSELAVSEVLMYGKSNSRLAWVYGKLTGPSNQLKIAGKAVKIAPQLNDSLATVGSLSVNGRAVYSSKTSGMLPAFSGKRLADGSFDIQNKNAQLSALFYTDGRSWSKLSGTMGKVAATPLNTLSGMGQLSAEEARMVGSKLLGNGPMLVGVVAIGESESKLVIEPKPRQHTSTVLYLASVDSTSSVNNSSDANSDTSDKSSTFTVTMDNTDNTDNQAVIVNSQPSFNKIDGGSNARVDSPNVVVARDAAGLAQIYSAAYGNQSGTPTVHQAQTNKTYVGVFIGERSTGGYSLSPVSTSVQGENLTLTVNITEPAKGGFVTMALTSPWLLVAVDGKYTSVNVVDQQGRSVTP